MNSWLCFPTLSAPMPFQMALDEILFRRRIEEPESRPLLRFYFSSEPWVTVGYLHDLSLRGAPQVRRSNRILLDNTAIASLTSFARNDVPICRRITGGGRVTHGEDLLFSLIASKEDDESFKSVRVSYWKIHEAVKKALEKEGEQPRFYRCDEKLPRGGECFACPIASDLALGNQKIAGGAQKRSCGALLHQESLQLPPRMDATELIAGLRGAFEEIFQVRLEDTVCDPEILEEAKILAREKYKKADCFAPLGLAMTD